MIAEIAFAFGWAHAELMEMDADELMAWHGQVARINKAVNGPGRA